jgi:hypothetical protein
MMIGESEIPWTCWRCAFRAERSSFTDQDKRDRALEPFKHFAAFVTGYPGQPKTSGPPRMELHPQSSRKPELIPARALSSDYSVARRVRLRPKEERKANAFRVCPVRR